MIHHIVAADLIACEGRAGTGPLAGLSRCKAVPYMDRSTDGAAGIAGRRLYIEPLERRLPQHFAISHRIHRAAPCQRQIVELVARMERIEEMEENLFVHCLN